MPGSYPANQYVTPPGAYAQRVWPSHADADARTIATTGNRTDATTVPHLPFVFPSFYTVQGGFRTLSTPFSGTTATGTAVYYPLIDFQPQAQSITQGVIVCSVRVEMCSTNPTGGIGFDPWGDLNGLGAAVVVGTNMWQSAGNQGQVQPLPFGGVDTSIAVWRTERSRYYWTTFPPGDFAAAGSQQKATVGEDWPPFILRVPDLDRVQAFFVLNNQTANNSVAANETLQGYVNVRMRLGLLNSPDYFPTGLGPQPQP